jgi:hypothetical protein
VRHSPPRKFPKAWILPVNVPPAGRPAAWSAFGRSVCQIGVACDGPERSVIYNELVTGMRVAFGGAGRWKMIVHTRMYAHT